METKLSGDNEARSSKQGGGSRRALIRAGFDRLRFQNLHDERLLEAQVEKDNFHQFNSDFHKEKEMVDFRKWLLALAVVGLLLGIGSSAANAQQINCSATSGVPNIIRAEGIAELLGDLILNCTSTVTATPYGVAVPETNVQISINTNITSRIVGSAGSNISEALLMIDEPYPSTAGGDPPPPVGTKPGASNAQAQLACVANNNTNCEIISKGPGIGVVGNYDGTPGHYNIFQGVQTGVNTIAWTGVPIDAPGTSGTRVIRITNIRANAFQLGVSSTLIPTQISEIVSINPSQTITVTQPNGGSVVGSVSPGLLQPPSVSWLGLPGSALYQQCNSVNTYLLSPPPPFAVTTDSGISVSAKEGFAYSFKPQNYAQYYDVKYLSSPDYVAPGTFVTQDIPGFAYYTESGFAPSVTGLVEPGSGTELVGFADHGTQILYNVNGIPAGVTLYAPSYIYLTGSYGTGTPYGLAVLVSQSAVTSGAFATSTTIPVVDSPSAATNGPPLAVSSGTSATLVYEIYYADPNVQETLTVPLSVQYTSNTASNIPATTTTPATVGVEFSPQSTVFTASSSAPIPRFGPSGSPQSLFSISPCSCNLLFPFVTNIAGFDTGVAIANTTSDPFGTSSQTGSVTLNYYGTTSGGGAAPPLATSSAITGGQELIFTLSNGGNFGIPATPGFEGYIIAQANFQYCHGFAFISDVGAQKLAEGYLAIELDIPGLNRTFNYGENEGH